MGIEVKPPFPVFTGTDGTPLEAGYVYIGTANTDPTNNPIATYWDNGLTVSANQPIRTINGYPSRAGSPATVFVAGDYSITVKDQAGALLYTSATAADDVDTIRVDLANPSDSAKGDSLYAVKNSAAGGVARTGDQKNADLVTPEDFGATGGSDDSGAFTNAASASKLILPGASSYTLASVPTMGTSTFIGRKLAALSGVGAADLQAINAILVESGYFGGVPIGSDVRNKKLEIICGVVRQDPTDRKKWFWIEDTSHAMTGFDNVYQNSTDFPPYGNLFAAGGSLGLKFKKTYKRALTFIAVPDETLSNSFGFTCGVSLGLSYLQLKGHVTAQLSGRIYYDGAAWVAEMGTYQGDIPGMAFASSALTVTHNDGSTYTGFCNGVGVTLTPHSVGGTIVPYTPVLKSVANGNFVVEFYSTTGARIAAVDTKMAFYWSKIMDIPAVLDGTLGHDLVSYSIPGNIWVCGIMEAI